nr:MAG TPA: hypothetical protein [Caudoviricetes sp.]
MAKRAFSSLFYALTVSLYSTPQMLSAGLFYFS